MYFNALIINIIVKRVNDRRERRTPWKSVEIRNKQGRGRRTLTIDQKVLDRKPSHLLRGKLKLESCKEENKRKTR